MYIPLLLSLTAGTRISETIGIKYSDVDFTSNTIYIDRQLGRSLKNEADNNLITQQLEAKTPNGIRSIPIPDWVADELIVRRAWYERQKLFVPNFCEMDYICCHCDGTPFHRKSFSDDFYKLTCMCGLPPVHWHDLRHMYASVLKNNAVNMKAISEFLGHASRTSQKKYTSIRKKLPMIIQYWKKYGKTFALKTGKNWDRMNYLSRLQTKITNPYLHNYADSFCFLHLVSKIRFLRQLSPKQKNRQKWAENQQQFQS